MTVRIEKNKRVILYSKTEDRVNIRVSCYTSGKITTCWSYCKPCYTSINKNKGLLNSLKVNGCAICGYSKCLECLEFHHSNPEDKVFPLSANYLYKSNKEIADELNKTILLCANCHMALHRGCTNGED